MEHLQLEIRGLLADSVAPRTHSLYQRAWQFFRWFNLRHGLFAENSHPTLHQLVQFIAFLSVNNYSPATISSYVSGIASTLRLYSLPDITQHFIVKRLLDGCRRRNSRRDTRRPITLDILRRIIPILGSVCVSQFEALLFRTAFLLAFFGFMRVGELTAPTRNAISPLKRSDVRLRHHLSGDVVELNVRFSKTDQHSHGCIICIPTVFGGDASLCPVRTASQYLSSSPPEHTHFLSHFDGSPLPRFQFSAVLRRALNFIGIQDPRYTSHSFRIGAATSAAMAGIPEHEIQRMGRWRSGVFRRYIRINPNLAT